MDCDHPDFKTTGTVESTLFSSHLAKALFTPSSYPVQTLYS